MARLHLWKIVQSSHHAQDSQCCDIIFCSTTQSCHGDVAHHQTIPVKPVLGLPSKLNDYMLLAPFLCKNFQPHMVHYRNEDKTNGSAKRLLTSGLSVVRVE